MTALPGLRDATTTGTASRRLASPPKYFWREENTRVAAGIPAKRYPRRDARQRTRSNSHKDYSSRITFESRYLILMLIKKISMFQHGEKKHASFSFLDVFHDKAQSRISKSSIILASRNLEFDFMNIWLKMNMCARTLCIINLFLL